MACARGHPTRLNLVHSGVSHSFCSFVIRLPFFLSQSAPTTQHLILVWLSNFQSHPIQRLVKSILHVLLECVFAWLQRHQHTDTHLGENEFCNNQRVAVVACHAANQRSCVCVCVCAVSWIQNALEGARVYTCTSTRWSLDTRWACTRINACYLSVKLANQPVDLLCTTNNCVLHE